MAEEILNCRHQVPAAGVGTWINAFAVCNLLLLLQLVGRSGNVEEKEIKLVQV